MKKASFLFLFILSCAVIFCPLAGCTTEQNKSVLVSLDGTKVCPQTLSVSVNTEPALVQFDSTKPELFETFGNKTYNCFNIYLAGSVDISVAKNSAIPLDANGLSVAPSANTTPPDAEVDYFTDYFTFSFPISQNTATIKFGTDGKLEALNKNRRIDGLYYLNFKWLYISPDKTQIKIYPYPNANYFYIETRNTNNTVLQEFLIHLTFDVSFI